MRVKSWWLSPGTSAEYANNGRYLNIRFDLRVATDVLELALLKVSVSQKARGPATSGLGLVIVAGRLLKGCVPGLLHRIEGWNATISRFRHITGLQAMCMSDHGRAFEVDVQSVPLWTRGSKDTSPEAGGLLRRLWVTG